MKSLFLSLSFVLLAACAGNDLERQRYVQWYNTLSPEQQEREDQRAHERSLAAMQALSRINAGQGVFGAPVYTPPPAPMYDMTVPAFQPRVRCTSQNVGYSVQTTCR